MRKYFGTVLVLIFILSMATCASNKKITLPEPEEIAAIEMMKSTSESGVKIAERDEISKMISEIKKNTKNTGKESVNDQPVNIEDYIIISFSFKRAEGNPSIAYLYKDRGISYIEQPYSGIWKLKEEVFDNISRNLTE